MVRSRHLVDTLNIHRCLRVQLIPPLPTPSIHHLAQAIDTAQRPVGGQPHPRVQRHVAFPKHPPFLVEAVLDREFHGPDGLVRGRRFVPHDARILGRVIRGRGAQLNFDFIFRRRALEVIEQPIGNLRIRAGARDGLRILLLHLWQDRKHGHVPIVFSESER